MTFRKLPQAVSPLHLVTHKSTVFDYLPFVNQRGLFVAEIDLQPQTVRVLDDRPDRRGHDPVVQADLDVVTDFVLRLSLFLAVTC